MLVLSLRLVSVRQVGVVIILLHHWIWPCRIKFFAHTCREYFFVTVRLVSMNYIMLNSIVLHEIYGQVCVNRDVNMTNEIVCSICVRYLIGKSICLVVRGINCLNILGKCNWTHRSFVLLQ